MAGQVSSTFTLSESLASSRLDAKQRTITADAFRGLQVRSTTDGRGNGAFAAAPIARGTFIGEYEGDMLSEVQYWSRYPSGMVRCAQEAV